MKILLLISALTLVLLSTSACASLNDDISTKVPTVEFDQEEALDRLRDKITGREDEPAGSVFDNVETMKEVPAARLLRIMEFGFSRSLGVDCTHCHNPDDFAEDTREKKVAREMMAMVGKINNDLLAAIADLEGDDDPMVNCTTCHRGDVEPALNLD
jgi:hypothetical protein